MDNKTKYGILGTLAVLVAGGVLVLTPWEYDNAWYCPAYDSIGIFEYTSSTNVTGYWHLEDGTRKQATCTRSKWIKLSDYCVSNDCSKIEIKQTQEDGPAIRYECEQECWGYMR